MLESVDEHPNVRGADLPGERRLSHQRQVTKAVTLWTSALAGPAFIRNWLRTHVFNVEAPSSSNSLEDSSSASSAALTASRASCAA